MSLHWTHMFVRVAPDCPVREGVVPVSKRAGKPAHVIQYELLSENPYTYTFEDQLFEVYIRHKGNYGHTDDEGPTRIREELLAKSHPCMRASMLPKKYGWGVHYNEEGRIAIYGMESEMYRKLEAEGTASRLELQTAMRNSRK